MLIHLGSSAQSTLLASLARAYPSGQEMLVASCWVHYAAGSSHCSSHVPRQMCDTGVLFLRPGRAGLPRGGMIETVRHILRSRAIPLGHSSR